jgi:P27 family predicted phage terminase small subunit
MRGEKPLPTNVKKLRGTLRKHRVRKNEPQPPARSSVPRPPERLKGTLARAKWRSLAADLWHLGLLPRISEDMLFQYCVAWQIYCDALEMVERVGSVVKTQSGNYIVSPWQAVVNRQAEVMRTIAQEFGMTPSSKTRVEGSPMYPGPTTPPTSSIPTWKSRIPIDPEHAFDEFFGN